MPDQPYDDCCDFCGRAERSRDESACSRSTARCKAAGDNCDTCKRCHTFRPAESFRSAIQLLRRRPEEPKTELEPRAPAKLKDRRIMYCGTLDRPAGKVGP